MDLKNTTDYQRRLNNARIFATALFKGEVKLCYEVHNNKNVAVYVPKEYLEDVKVSPKTLEED